MRTKFCWETTLRRGETGCWGQRGQTLMEVAAAMGVAVIIIAALVSLGVSAMRSSNYSKNRAVATQVANEALEAMRSKRDTADFSFFVAGQCYQLTASHTISDIAITCPPPGEVTQEYPDNPEIKYKIEVVDVSAPVLGKKIMATIRFADSAGSHDVTASTVLTDWK